MYLSLRSKNLNAEDDEGQTVLVIYLLRKDIDRMKQLIMRGCNINHTSRISKFTPLHWAVEAVLSTKIIKFLLQNGAEKHYEDKDGRDCCDKAQKLERYKEFKAFTDYECLGNPSLRMNVSKKRVKMKSRAVTLSLARIVSERHKKTSAAE